MVSGLGSSLYSFPESRSSHFSCPVFSSRGDFQTQTIGVRETREHAAKDTKGLTMLQ